MPDVKLDEETLTYHFQRNFIPPIPLKMIPAAMDAVREVRNKNPKAMIQVGNAPTIRTFAAINLVESLKLEEFI